jgi:hypothetical protein
MSAASDFPQVEVSVVVLERAGLILAEFNPKWEMFTLPMARLRRRPGPGDALRETPSDAALRAATKALGRPLPPQAFPKPLSLDVPSHLYLHSRRDQNRKRYTYHVFGRRVVDPSPRHAIGWHVLWLKPEEFRSYEPVSPTAKFVVEHLSEELFAV